MGDDDFDIPQLFFCKEPKLFGFAADYDGLNGPLHRILVEPSKDGASPLDQLAPIETQSSVYSLHEMMTPPARVSFEGRMKNAPMVKRSIIK